MAFREFDAAVSRRSLLRGGAYLAAAGAFTGLPLGRMALAHDVSEAWPHVAARVEQFVSSGKVANIVAGFGWRADAPHSVARGALRFGKAPEAGLDSLYRIYSMTKPVTGMAVMICIEDGLISLDQPLGEILPAFAEMRVLKRPDGPLDETVPAERPITIRHLLTHTAGLGYDVVSKGPLRDALFANGIVSGQVSRIPIPGFPNATPAPGLAAWADRLAKLPLIAQPGTKWSYSCSLDLLGRVIEVASGKAFDAFLQERIFDPCGMTSTWFRVPASEVERLADNYGVLNGVPLPIDPAASSIYLDQPPIIWGGSGLVSSPRDYDRFLEMLLGYGTIGGKHVMGADAVRVGTSNLLPDGADTTGTYVAGEGFGAGGRVSGRSYGWGGAAGTLASVDFDRQLRATLFTQYMPSEAFPIRQEFQAALAQDLGAARGTATLG